MSEKALPSPALLGLKGGVKPEPKGWSVKGVHMIGPQRSLSWPKEHGKAAVVPAYFLVGQSRVPRGMLAGGLEGPPHSATEPARLTGMLPRCLRTTSPYLCHEALRFAVAVALLCCLLVLQAPTATARVYHVDVNTGKDTSPGTQSEPFRTLAHASSILQPGDKAVIHPGIYHEQIMKGNSGRSGAPITYEGTDRSGVILDGSVRITDWHRNGDTWTKKGLRPITPENAFVMIDERRLLKRAASLEQLEPGTFFLAADGTYTIRLWNDADPNTEHLVDVYELDLAFNAGDRWGGTSRRWIVLRSLTLQKYGGHSVSTDLKHPKDSDHWELDDLTVRYNYHEGVFACLDDWYVHGCSFVRNRGHGCQLNGSRIRFEGNESNENEWFGEYEHGGCGILVGPDESAAACTVSNNVFRDNGDMDGYGCGVYLEGRSHGNRIEKNVVTGGTHAGICFYGSSHNVVTENVLEAIASRVSSPSSGAFVVGPSFEGEPNTPVGNLVARNTIRDCSTPVACIPPKQPAIDGPYNRFADNVFVGCRYRSRLDLSCPIVMENNQFHGCSEKPRNPIDSHDLIGPISLGRQGGEVTGGLIYPNYVVIQLKENTRTPSRR